MAAVLEYMVSEVIESAGHVSINKQKKRINPRHIQIAIQNDEEMKKLLQNVTIAGGGVQPHIHPVLLPMKSSKKPKAAAPPPMDYSDSDSNNNSPVYSD